MENDTKDLISTERLNKDLKPSIGDYGYALINAGASTGISIIFPPFAPIFSALFGTVILPPPISKRLNDFLSEVTEELKELEQKVENFKIEDLAKNESFLTTLIHAYELVIRTHQEEKLEALRNAVLNSALPNAPEDDIKIIFLKLIESFTVTHIKLLKFFSESKSEGWIYDLAENIDHNFYFADSDSQDNISIKIMTFDFNKVLEYVFPDFIENNLLYHYTLKDLISQEMLIADSSAGTLSYVNIIPINGYIEPQVQPFGKQFIKFIEPP